MIVAWFHPDKLPLWNINTAIKIWMDRFTGSPSTVLFFFRGRGFVYFTTEIFKNTAETVRNITRSHSRERVYKFKHAWCCWGPCNRALLCVFKKGEEVVLWSKSIESMTYDRLLYLYILSSSMSFSTTSFHGVGKWLVVPSICLFLTIIAQEGFSSPPSPLTTPYTPNPRSRSSRSSASLFIQMYLSVRII